MAEATRNVEPVEKGYTVLILAANRKGARNPVAQMGGYSHKCVVPILGIPMIDRVLRTIVAWGKAQRILISIEDASVLDGAPFASSLRDSGRVTVLRSGETLAASVLSAAETLSPDDYPLLITTGDNVMHTVPIVDDFRAMAEAAGADVAFALTPRAVVAASYPAEAPDVGYLRFAEGEHSNCNIYFLRRPEVLPVVRTMREGGQFRHYPLRILKAFGLVAMVKYQLGIVRISDIERRLRRLFRANVKVIIFPHPTAPIDVDGLTSFALAERLLRQLEDHGQTQSS